MREIANDVLQALNEGDAPEKIIEKEKELGIKYLNRTQSASSSTSEETSSANIHNIVLP
jgi:hypothetical protein